MPDEYGTYVVRLVVTGSYVIGLVVNDGHADSPAANVTIAVITNQAYDKLKNDILGKTDGCVKVGTPDANDWIKTCPEQALVYPLITGAIEHLERLM